MFIEENCVVIEGTRFELINDRWCKDGEEILTKTENGPMDGWEFQPNTFVSVDDQIDFCHVLMIERGDRMLEIYRDEDGEWDITARINCNGDWDHVHQYDALDFLSHKDSDDIIRESRELK